MHPHQHTMMATTAVDEAAAVKVAEDSLAPGETKNEDSTIDMGSATEGQQDEGGKKKKEEEEKKKKGDDSSFKYFMRVFKYNDAKGWFMNAVALVCMIAAGTVLPLMDVVFGKFINVFNDFVTGRLTPDGYMDEVGKYTLYFVYLFIAKFGLTYAWTILVNITAIRTTKKLRVDFVRQTLRQEVSFFDAPSSSVSGQITTNGNLVNNGISEKLGLTIQAIASFVTAFIVAFAVQWKLTLILLAIVPLNLVVTIWCVVKDTVLEYRMFDIYSESGSLAEEAFSTIRTAHAFWAFPKLVDRFDAILERARQVGRGKSLIYAILFPVEFFCVIAGYALAFWQGIRMYSTGEIEQPGTVVTVIFAVLVAAQALTQIAPQTIAISKATAAAQDLFAIIDRKSAIDSLAAEGTRITDFKGDIKLRGVKFSYPSRASVPVLHGLDLDIPSDKTTALVGASGSGKSTIFGLLERWYSFSAGSITLDGHRLEDLNLQWLRTNIRLVQQEPTLFSGTIYQNVVDGLTGTNMVDLPDDEKSRLVREACQAAYAHDFIEDLPKGYETYIGERGASLSGGQKQRIVIARSIISNPKVLLLDEATSALDPNAEKIVQAALNNVAKGRTMVVIAHRLSTIRDADNIVVMSKGETVESGTHAELIALGGAYARLVKAQDLGKGGGGGTAAEDADEESEEERGKQPVDLDVALTRASTTGTIPGLEPKEGEKYGLFYGLFLILKEQRSLWWPMAVTVLCCAVGGGSYPALAVLFSKTMSAFETIDVSKGNFFSLMFFVVALANFVAYAVAGWLANILAQTVMKFYRSEIFNNTLRQDMTFFDHPHNSTGALVSRLAAEPTSLQELLSMNVALLVVNVVNLLSSAILAIAVGWKLGLVLAFGALPVLVGAGYVRIRLEFKFEDDTAGRFAESSGVAAEAVMGIRTVSSLALERAVVERYEARLQGIAGAAMSSLGWKMFFYALSQSVSFLAMGLGFWYGGKLVSTGEYTTDQFYTVFIAVVFSGESAAMLFQYSTSITKARTAINYIFRLRRERELFDAPDDSSGSSNSGSEDQQGSSGSSCTGEDDGKAGTEKEKGAAAAKGTELVCDAVEFAYPLRPKTKVLRGIDVTMRSGRMVAFVGASGCGKSTMIALLQRFYDPVAGELRADGHDIKTLDRCRYRRDVALVQQEPVLYQGSIRENVSLGLERGEPSAAQLEAACRAANVWDFVASLPQGLDTPCGSQGLSLSGGQRQRIAIARALVRGPRMLLLDEATSALDTESEKVVKEALDRASAGRTTVAVAHRLSTVRDADLICVFAKGCIVERGTHDELLDRRGLYYEMVLGQSLDREAA
ncbi:lipid A export ATP-binding/permease protein msbA [Purpureocillium lavendulum]|uniref:Lipid A export ATP-binding/permease protein msbA n=1 Tax=Purpureocillium lavendulum TaxID=1247861 RepID=A0AB34FT12_9HYPO|nr:lipid A export ATP-binding/permease protein msbA [Purpureocillium lavendulum]